MKISELRDLKTEELLEKLEDYREEIMRFRFQQATGELTDFNQMKATRKNIARILTLLSENAKSVDMEGEA